MGKILSIITRLFMVVVVILVGALGVVAAMLYTQPFADWRREIAADILASLLKQDVTVSGQVSVDLARRIAVSINNVEMTHPLRPDDEKQHVNFVSFSFLTWAALSGEFEITSFVLKGARIAVTSEDEKEDADEMEGLGETVARFLNNPLSSHFVLADVRLDIDERRNGWRESIVIDRLSFLEGETGETIEIHGGGTVNRFRLSLDGTVGTCCRSGQPPGPRPMELSIGFPGSTTRLSGSIDVTNPIAAIDLSVYSFSPSLGDLLDVLGLRRVIEGNGHLTAHLGGPMNELRASEIDAGAAGSREIRLELSGDIRNLNRGEGVDLDFAGTLPPEQREPDQTGPIIDIQIEGFDGELAGNFGELVLERFTLETNLALAELEEIGPISIDRITKDQQRRLGFYGIRILDGPAERPTLDISGNIIDVLQLAGISLTGQLDISTADFLAVETAGDRSRLGRITGQVSIADSDGTLGLEALTLKVIETDLLSLSIAAKIDEFRDLEDIALDINLDVPSFRAFASYFGEKTSLKGPLRFGGRLSLTKDTPRIDGRVTVGKTVIDGNLKAELRDHRPFLVGAIRSRSVHMDDLRGLVDAIDILGIDETERAELRGDLAKKIVTIMDIDIARIAGKGNAIGKITGRARYDNQIITIEPIRATFMKGRINAAVRVDLTNQVPRVRVRGKIGNLPILSILRELNAPPIVTGRLTTNLTLSGLGSSPSQFARTMSGQITTSIYGGSVNTNLVDLSGLNSVTWLFTRSNRNVVKIVCAVVPLTFRNGRGRTTKTVFETESVQIVGGGSVDFRKSSINLHFQPIPKRKQMIKLVTAFSVTGDLSKPTIRTNRAAGRIAAEIITLPINLLSFVVTRGRPKTAQGKPCVVPRPKKKLPRKAR